MKIKRLWAWLKRQLYDCYCFAFPAACSICVKPMYSDPGICESCKEVFLSGREFRIAGIPLYTLLKYNSSTRGFYLSIKTENKELKKCQIDRLIDLFCEKTGKDHVIVPVPSNSSDLPVRISQAISDRCGCRILPILQAKGEKLAQKSFQRSERKKNVRNAFVVDNSKIICYNLKKTDRIILVDDMKTTGETLREICRVMKTEGLVIDFLVTYSYRED